MKSLDLTIMARSLKVQLRRIPAWCLVAFVAMLLAGRAHAQPVPDDRGIRKMLLLPEEKIDLLDLKLSVDKAIDPSTDVDATRKQVEAMVADIQRNLPATARSAHKLGAIRQYLYGKGPWNNFQPFQYDFSDPDGKSLHLKLLSNYLRTRKGNCVSMPILMMLIADRMGLDVSLSYAPAHILMKFTESETGRTYNVEATSGGGFSRDQWYQETMHVTHEEIRNSVYLQKLTRKETAYALADLLGDRYIDLKAYDKALDFFKMALTQNPNSVYYMLSVGGSYAKIYAAEFYKYERISEVPLKDRPRLYFLREQNQKYFQMAEARGWREKPPEPVRSMSRENQTSNRYGT
jgi:regulator of sirC expression with transglutaminase-like and TPR domain